MNHKDAYFRLAPGDRRTIQPLVSALAALNIVEFSVATDLGLGPIVGILGNLLALYWCIFPQKAVDWCFKAIPYLCVVVLVFDGAAVFRSVSGGTILNASGILSLAKLVALVALAPPFSDIGASSGSGLVPMAPCDDVTFSAG